MTEETIPVKAIVVTDQAAGTVGMTLVERPEPQAAINDGVVEVHASGFVPTELTWPSTWTDRLDRDPERAHARLDLRACGRRHPAGLNQVLHVRLAAGAEQQRIRRQLARPAGALRQQMAGARPYCHEPQMEP